jgi:hypothetical protein
MAIIAQACGATLELNEIAPHRSALLDGLFPAASRTRHDAAHLKDTLPSSGSFQAVIANPPFQRLDGHLHAAIDCLAEGGRLSAIVPTRLFEDAGAMQALSRRGRVVALIALGRSAWPARPGARSSCWRRCPISPCGSSIRPATMAVSP